jgi:hypothetical protein
LESLSSKTADEIGKLKSQLQEVNDQLKLAGLIRQNCCSLVLELVRESSVKQIKELNDVLQNENLKNLLETRQQLQTELNDKQKRTQEEIAELQRKIAEGVLLKETWEHESQQITANLSTLKRKSFSLTEHSSKLQTEIKRVCKLCQIF